MDQPLTLQQAVDLANKHSDAGRLSEAETLYRQILGHDPNHSTALHGLGLIGLRTGHHGPAADMLARAAELAPYIPQYRTNWAIALRSAGRADEALRVLQETVARFPQHVQGLRELGATLGVLNRPAEAIVAYEQALRLRAAQPPGPNDAADREIDSRVHINIGAMLAAMNRFDEAIVASERAIALAPSSAVAHMNRGHLLFRKGRLREAFAEYDWRWKIPDFTARWPTYPQPAWDGADPRGKTILLWHEQGMGDTIHFVRYAPLVAQRGAKVIVLCQRPLVTLLRTLDPQVQIITDEIPLPVFDLHLPLAGLPRVFQTERETIPFRDGYLRADAKKAADWAGRLKIGGVDSGNNQPLRVALVWAGSPGHLNDRNRSVTLESLKPTLAVRNVRFVSMQKGDATSQLAPFPSILDLGKHLDDFSDSAALLANIDLLITVDTAAAHLAGAMGRQVWTLVTFDPDFRWLCDQDRSCWYSSLRLFRQPTPGDWPGAIAKIAEELNHLANPPIAAPADSDPAAQAAALHNAALAAFQNGEHQRSLDLMNRAVSVAPADPRLRHALATLYRLMNRHPEAIDVLRQALAIIPGSFLLHRELAASLKLAGQNESAIAEYQIALQAHAVEQSDAEARRLDDANAHMNLGLALYEVGRFDEALAALDRSLELNPDSGEAHMKRLTMRFRKGDLRGGFADYEHRTYALGKADFQQLRWDGADLSGKTILLYGEQGFGDTIQFSRYVPLVARCGAKVILRCKPALARLLQSLEGAAQVVPDDSPLPPFDVYAPILSLPYIMETTLETLPAPRRYLAADRALIEQLGQRLAERSSPPPEKRLRVGLVIAGSSSHGQDALRSLKAAQIAPWLALNEIEFVSLQKGPTARELAQLYGNRIIDFAEELGDFADTAALIENLDLVLTVDTAVAHLAGALGKDVWMLVAAEPEFRWLFETRQSRWYPSMRIYRQPAPGDWEGAIAKVAQELNDFARSRASHSVGSALADAERQPAKPTSAKADPTRIAQVHLGPPASSPSANSLLAAAQQHHAAGRIDQAMPLYQQVLALEPDNAGALHHLGLISHQRGSSEQALPLMERSVQIDPSQAPYFKNLATVCRAIGRHEDAVRWIGKAIELSPADPMLHEELGVTLERLDRLDEAIAAYRKAIDLLANAPLPPMLNDPNRRRIFEAKLHSNMGATLGRNSLYEEAMPYFEHAIKLNPDYGVAHMHRANVLFRRRDLPSAFAEYEWRFAAKGFPTPWRKYPQPVWDGSNISGRRILLWPEQGMGDVIQFARFAPILADMGAQVIVQCMPPLKRALQTLGHGVQVIGEDPLPPFDVHLPLISIPRVLGTSYETLPAPQKYLSADPQLAAEWANRLAGPRGLRVGIVWSGSPSFAENRRRSIPPEKLSPLTQIERVRWFSLQMGLAASQLVEFDRQHKIVDLSKQIGDFADTAAILANLDLLISTDTSIVHLSGALGVETWVMLWSERDFRWQLDDTRMPWYPSVRPFLQSSAGQWDDVVSAIESELRKRALAT